MNTPEIELFDTATEKLKQNTGFTVEINKNDIDATGFIETGASRLPVAIDIKRSVTNSVLPALKHQFTQMNEHGLLVTHHINPLMAERLRGMDIWFIDTAGNAYINALPVYVYMSSVA